jgi:hypothetical protein
MNTFHLELSSLALDEALRGLDCLMRSTIPSAMGADTATIAAAATPTVSSGGIPRPAALRTPETESDL